jgi:deoxyribodipyrimidine photo-lyase
MSDTAVLWFRRDLRTGDHPALLAAERAADVLGVFVLDEDLLRSSGAIHERQVALERYGAIPKS